MARGGKRNGAGRPLGAVTKTKAARALAIAVAGITPKEFLLNGMAAYQKMIVDELALPVPDMAKVLQAYAGGAQFAKDAAPYCHARLASITHSGQINSDVEVRDARDRLTHLVIREAAIAGATNRASGATH